MTPRSPTVRLKTIGCRLNQAETARIAARFEAAGWQLANDQETCDVAVINTCTITHSAERDCARWARRLRREGARYVILAGCAVEHNGEALKKATGADILADQDQKYSLPERLADDYGIHGNPQRTNKDKDPNPSAPIPVFDTTRGLVKVQDGCDFRCSYCIVPETRGLPHSRSLCEILDEIQRLVDDGYREITLTGANLGCYSDPPNSLLNLLEKMEPINGLARIRIGSIETTTVEREIIDFMATSAKLCHFLHMPLQSGDDGILQRMGRRYSAKQFGNTVEYAVSRVPDIGLGTDIIVGFPGESENAFQNTRAMLNELPFSNLHVFTYSRRRGTPAADLSSQIPANTKKERSRDLIAIGKAKRHAFCKSFIGKPVSVLIEKSTPTASGWSSQYLPVKIQDTNRSRNQLVICQPHSLQNDTLIAKMPPHSS